jgi:hypothetical protein
MQLQFFYDNVPWQSPYYNVKLLYKQPTHSSALYTLEFLPDEGLLVRNIHKNVLFLAK